MGDTLWHFPQMPPIEVIRGETVHRISDLLRTWGVEPAGELFFLGRDIRAAIEKATDEAYWGDLTSPDYPALAKQVAAAKGLTISDEQAQDALAHLEPRRRLPGPAALPGRRGDAALAAASAAIASAR